MSHKGRLLLVKNTGGTFFHGYLHAICLRGHESVVAIKGKANGTVNPTVNLHITDL